MRTRTKVFWMVVRTDMVGNSFLMRDGLSKKEAIELVLIFTKRGHKQDYRYYSYTRETRVELISKYRIFV